MRKDIPVSSGFGRSALGNSLVAGLVATFGVGVATLGLMGEARRTMPEPSALATTGPAFDPSRFLLNGLLAPAIDAEALPLRWIDPRPAMGCGTRTSVMVDGRPLRHGELVPDVPFELEWRSDGCRPFGAQGPRLDGNVRLTVFREDWGFSAMVEPLGMRITRADGELAMVTRGSATMPQSIEEPAEHFMFLL